MRKMHLWGNKKIYIYKDKKILKRIITISREIQQYRTMKEKHDAIKVK